MDLREIFDTYTAAALLSATIIVYLLCHAATVKRFLTKAVSRIQLESPAASPYPRSEAEIRRHLRELHKELCLARGLPELSSFTELPGCPQMTMILESAQVDESGRLQFTYDPWLKCDENF